MAKKKAESIIKPEETELKIQEAVKKYEALEGEEARNAFLLSEYGLEMVSMMARENYSDTKIAFILKKTDMVEFREKNPILNLYYKYGEDKKLHDIEDAMFKAAKGFIAQEHFVEVRTDSQGNETRIDQIRERAFPPDHRAQQSIIFNKLKEIYKDRQEDGGNLPFSGITVKVAFDDGNDQEKP